MATVVRPEIHTIVLASGETLVVKKRLNAGERREMLKMMRLPDGRVDGLMSGPACVLAYLVDWTVTDDGKPLIIREQPSEIVAKTLDALDVEDYKEIEFEIELHDDKMSAERRAEKKRQIQLAREAREPKAVSPSTSPSSEPNSPSAVDSDSGTTTSTS
jgi:hypothetical protein